MSMYFYALPGFVTSIFYQFVALIAKTLFCCGIIEAVVFKKKYLLILIPLVLTLAPFIYFHFNLDRKIEMKVLGLGTIQDMGQPKEINTNGRVKVKYPQDYTLVLLGDSMTEKLGNSDELRAYLKKYYPNKTFEVLNYGFGSTNILSAQERLEKETFHGRNFRPILDIAFDLILIESFGHNPLSEFNLEEGLKKQTEVLDKIVEVIKKASPEAKIVFIATVSPNKSYYAKQTDLTPEKRSQWAEERISYIKNHIEYAKTHNIPLVNIFEKSLNVKGDGDLNYIDSTDLIHPSPNGVYLISEEIAKYIFNNRVLSP